MSNVGLKGLMDRTDDLDGSVVVVPEYCENRSHSAKEPRSDMDNCCDRRLDERVGGGRAGSGFAGAGNGLGANEDVDPADEDCLRLDDATELRAGLRGGGTIPCDGLRCDDSTA
jgi:hypothetical protein